MLESIENGCKILKCLKKKNILKICIVANLFKMQLLTSYLEFHFTLSKDMYYLYKLLSIVKNHCNIHNHSDDLSIHTVEDF